MSKSNRKRTYVVVETANGDVHFFGGTNKVKCVILEVDDLTPDYFGQLLMRWRTGEDDLYAEVHNTFVLFDIGFKSPTEKEFKRFAVEKWREFQPSGFNNHIAIDVNGKRIPYADMGAAGRRLYYPCGPRG